MPKCFFVFEGMDGIVVFLGAVVVYMVVVVEVVVLELECGGTTWLCQRNGGGYGGSDSGNGALQNPDKLNYLY